MNLKNSAVLLFVGILSFSACKKEEVITPNEYEVPATYNFENVSYSGQTQRINMFAELKSYMKGSRTLGVALDASRLKAMYENDAANASWQGTYDASKQLKSKTFTDEQAKFDLLLEELATASASTVTGSTGQSGVIESLDGVKSYLIGDDGLDHAQIIEKGLMGACLYFQTTAVYFGTGKMDVDNETVEAGKGTEMEHHWDEAFGYFGVPIDFPTNTDGLAFWGNYSNKRNSVLESNSKIMSAFLKGRAAISNKDLTKRDEAIEEARAELELVSVGSALHYLNASIANFNDVAIRAHALSEGIGFIYALRFNPSAKVSLNEINDLLITLAGSASFENMDINGITTADLNTVKDQLATFYSLESKKDLF